jgi:tripartite-type tricarboxylate transporter receptor subunit TctC
MRGFGHWAALVCTLMLVAAGARAQDVEGFYRGKTMNLIVPSAGGGIFELSSQLVARHLGKFIPGKPNIVVQTQPGTGGIALANRFGAGTDRDGLTIAFMSRAAPQFPMIGDRNATYDSMKFTWLGSISSYANDAYLFVLNSDNAAKTVDDLRKPGPGTPIGANRTGSATVTFALLARDVLKLNVQVVRGFPGAAEVVLAMQRHEVEGVTSDLSAFAGAGGMHDMWDKNLVRPIVQFGRLTRLASMPDVPTGRELATDPKDRALIEFAEMPFFMAFPFAAPVGIPEDRAKALQTAFMKMVADPAFLDDAKRVNIDISAIDGEAIKKLIADASKTPPDVLARFKAMIGE